MTPADLRRLEHVLDAIDRASRYTARGRSSLDHDETLDAVLHCLTVVGEALAALSPEAYARLASLPAHRPKGQRNLIVHEYWRVDPDIVWDTVRLSLPQLQREIVNVLGADGDDEGRPGRSRTAP